MNFIIHFLINFFLGILLRLNLLEILFFVLGGLLIDLDHPIYLIFKKKIYSLKEMLKWHKKEFRRKGRFRFIFHQIELLAILFFAGYFINNYLFLFFAGAIVHWFFDILSHIHFYKNFGSLRYYSGLVSLLAKDKNL